MLALNLHPSMHPQAPPRLHRGVQASVSHTKGPALSCVAARRSTGRVRPRAVAEEATATPEPGPSAFPGVEVSRPVAKPTVVVLGSGWGAISFMKALSREAAGKYDVILVSPRNYFLYTPLLPAVATGTMEERSIVEPIRNVMIGKGEYYEAICQQVDPANQTIVACFPKDAGFPEACFRLKYDHLIVAVGSVNNTFGVKGVKEHAYFFKSVEDANKLRAQVSECFERAALPYTPQEEKQKLLTFVIVGGGPTGVEVAAELYDMVTEDMNRLYGDLSKSVKICVVELMDHVLSAYDRRISDYTHGLFKRNGISLVLNSRVTRIEKNEVFLVDTEGKESLLEFGACVWATGVARNPLITQMQESLPGQNHFRSLLTDDKLRVVGSRGTIWAVGDASSIAAPKALDYADELFEEADVDKSDTLELQELRELLQTASKRFPQFEEHARFLNVQGGGIGRFGGIVRKAFATSSKATDAEKVFENITEESSLTREEFKAMLKTIDLGLRSLPATAQVARQQGEWVAKVFTRHSLKDGESLPEDAEDFSYSHKGALAYVGRDRAVLDVPTVGPLWGVGAGIVWKGFETYSQFSLRNRALVTLDWLRTKLFGRDISRV